MALNPTHEMHKRRFGRNLGVALLLGAFVALVFALTVVKVTRGDPMQGYDHVVQPEAVPGATAPAEGGTP
ncbi:hypothetical protein [Neotabrizicola sp. VNH66]|uniref:hypothetical protein n=1 Tax=Neotabrizicola sp. VNH66 TaxID=3400918 RepID=UPI003BFC514F